tara:strand:+ start:12042 stop:12395 length:354 start_codon:yes stop_codon:yes gene_type:complete
MKYTIYHNPRCRKSREGLEYLKSKVFEIEIIEYLKNPLTISELENLIELLGIEPQQLVRTNEAIWKVNFKGSEHLNQQIISILINNPKLIERPIISNGTNAIIGRPLKNLIDFLKSH